MKRNRLYFGLALLSFVVLWIVSASPFAPVCLALLCLPIPVCLLWNRICSSRLRCALTADNTGEKGEPITLDVRVSAGRCVPAAGIRCVLTAENTLTGFTERICLTLHPHGKAYRVRTSYTSPYCGQIRFRIQSLLLPDLYAVAALHADAGNCKTSCTVFPRTFPMDCRDILLPAAQRDTDAFAQQGHGSDPTEVFQLREYIPGDPLRGIHWKLSSKTDTLIYRDPAAPVRRAILVFWDREAGSPAQKDTLAECIFSLCQALCEAGCPFSLGYTGTIGCTIEDIPDGQALPEKLPALLRRAEGDRVSLPDLSEFGRTLWFTADASAVPAHEDLFALVCTDTAANLSSVSGVVCTPENYIRVMQRLDLHDEKHG